MSGVRPMTKPSTLIMVTAVFAVILLSLAGFLIQARANSLSLASGANNGTVSAATARKEDLLAHQAQLQAAVDQLNATLQQQQALEQSLSDQLASLTGQQAQTVQPSRAVAQPQPIPQPVAQPMPMRTTRAS